LRFELPIQHIAGGGMKTYTFIGSDKNAGKTTAMNYVYRELLRAGPNPREICLASIGINGECVDAWDRSAKPVIRVRRRTLFVTAGEHLSGLSGSYAVIDSLSAPGFPKTYVFARAVMDLQLVLEGPNEKAGVLVVKEMLERYCKNAILLLDGSIDRQFIGHPAISDGVLLSLLVSDRPEQQLQLADLLAAITLPAIDYATRQAIAERAGAGAKSLLLNGQHQPVYHGDAVPFLDRALHETLLASGNEPMILYLDGSLSRSLHDLLAPLDQLTVVLNSFSHLQRFAAETGTRRRFRPKLTTLHPLPIICIFLKQETERFRLRLPPQVPVFNLHRGIPDEAVI